MARAYDESLHLGSCGGHAPTHLDMFDRTQAVGVDADTSTSGLLRLVDRVALANSFGVGLFSNHPVERQSANKLLLQAPDLRGIMRLLLQERFSKRPMPILRAIAGQFRN
jgi:hypothetical protein